jgi:hypothetical protein
MEINIDIMSFKILPSETFTIHTQDSIEVVCQRLMAQVEDSSTIRNSLDFAVFRGQVSNCGFNIYRITKHKNIFLPIIYGEFIDVSDGITIQISMGLDSSISRFFHIIYINFNLLLLTMSILKSLVDLKIVIISTSISLSLRAIPSELLAILLFGSYFLIFLIKYILKNLFRNEVKFTRQKLIQIFLD